MTVTLYGCRDVSSDASIPEPSRPDPSLRQYSTRRCVVRSSVSPLTGNTNVIICETFLEVTSKAAA